MCWIYTTIRTIVYKFSVDVLCARIIYVFLWKFDFPPSPPHYNCEYELIWKFEFPLSRHLTTPLSRLFGPIVRDWAHAAPPSPSLLYYRTPYPTIVPVGVRGRSSEVGTPTVPRYVSGPLEMEAPSHLNWSHWRWKNEPEEHKKSKVTNLRDVEQ